jgi:hypothetical protein
MQTRIWEVFPNSNNYVDYEFDWLLDSHYLFLCIDKNNHFSDEFFSKKMSSGAHILNLKELIEISIS